jgi:hypothetical protein
MDKKKKAQARQQEKTKAKTQANKEAIYEVSVQAVQAGLKWDTPSVRAKGHFALGQSPKEKLTPMGCGQSRWQTYKTNIAKDFKDGTTPKPPPPPGGARLNAGAPRVALDGSKGSQVTAEDSKRRQRHMANEREDTYYLDYTTAELDFRRYLAIPFLILLAPQIISYPQLLTLAVVARLIFERPAHSKHQADSTTIFDTSKEDGTRGVTGQMRTILFPYKLQLHRERIHKPIKGIYDDRIVLSQHFWVNHPQEEALIKHLRTTIGDILRSNENIKKIAEHGYPRADGEVEIEILMTPPKTGMQDGHQDTRQNTVTVFLPLGMSQTTTTLSTWVAKANTNFTQTATKPIEYERFTVHCGDNFMSAFCNHAAWMHKGPGNQNTTPR